MATHHTVYRFRMRPTRSQEQSLNRLAGARRWVWNWALARWKGTYAATGKSITLKQLSAELTALKEQPETAWLKEADSQSLQQVLKDLHRAFTNFFEKSDCYPRFKSKKRDPARFRIPQRVKIADGKVYVPKVGQVRIRQSRPVEEKTKSATFRRSADGKWYVTLTVEFDMPDIPLPAPDPAKVVGIDLGLKTFATITAREPIPSPQFFRKESRQNRLSDSWPRVLQWIGCRTLFYRSSKRNTPALSPCSTRGHAVSGPAPKPERSGGVELRGSLRLSGCLASPYERG